MVDITDLRMTLAATGQIADVALMLLNNRIVSAEDMRRANIGSPRNVIAALREKLEAHDIEVRSHRRMGYWLEHNDKTYLISLCSHGEAPKPEEAQ